LEYEIDPDDDEFDEDSEMEIQEAFIIDAGQF
jgi:hypothetical protein